MLSNLINKKVEITTSIDNTNNMGTFTTCDSRKNIKNAVY